MEILWLQEWFRLCNNSEQGGKESEVIWYKGKKEGHFTNLFGLAISTDGHILAVDHHRVQKVTFNGGWE